MLWIDVIFVVMLSCLSFPLVELSSCCRSLSVSEKIPGVSAVRLSDESQKPIKNGEGGRKSSGVGCLQHRTYLRYTKNAFAASNLPSLHVLFGRAEGAVARIYNNYVFTIIDIQNNGIHTRQLDESTCNESQFDANNSEFV